MLGSLCAEQLVLVEDAEMTHGPSVTCDREYDSVDSYHTIVKGSWVSVFPGMLCMVPGVLYLCLYWMMMKQL